MSKTVGIAFFKATGAPPPPPSKPMDTYAAGMLHCYGLKQVLGPYVGPVVRVRRSSDNAEQDIGYVTGGALDTTTLATFVGSSDGFVTTWYDQISSGAVNAAQATTGKQPKIVSAGTYLGYIQFDGVDDYLITHTTAVTALSFAGFIKYSTAVSSGSASYFAHSTFGSSGNTLGCQYQHNNTETNTYIFTGNSNYSHQAANFSSSYTSIVLVCDRTSYPPAYYADGAARGISSDTVGSPTSAAFTDEDLYIGSDGSSQPAAIQAQEFIIWTVNQNANFTGIFSAL